MIRAEDQSNVLTQVDEHGVGELIEDAWLADQDVTDRCGSSKVCEPVPEYVCDDLAELAPRIGFILTDGTKF